MQCKQGSWRSAATRPRSDKCRRFTPHTPCFLAVHTNTRQLPSDLAYLPRPDILELPVFEDEARRQLAATHGSC